MDANIDSENSPKMKIFFVVFLLILIGELIYFTQFSGIKIPFKFPTPSFTSLITFVDSLKPISIKIHFPTKSPTKYPTKIPSPIQTLDEEVNIPSTKYQGKISSINSIKIASSSTPVANKVEFSFYIETGDTEWAKEYHLFSYNKTELNVMKVFDKNGKIISYKDLKVGQDIKIIQNYNLKEKLLNIKIFLLE